MATNTDKLMKIANTVANTAITIEKKVFYFLLIAIVCASTIAWHWLDFTALLSIGSFVKIILLCLPILLWFSLWRLVKQLTQLPENLVELSSAGEQSLSLVSNLNTEKNSQKSLISNLFSLIKTIREPEIFENIVLCTKGLVLLTNPLSFVALLASAFLIIIFIFVALSFAIF